jgi:hypothetical protein
MQKGKGEENGLRQHGKWALVKSESPRICTDADADKLAREPVHMQMNTACGLAEDSSKFSLNIAHRSLKT